jgi:hypothetical protein
MHASAMFRCRAGDFVLGIEPLMSWLLAFAVGSHSVAMCSAKVRNDSARFLRGLRSAQLRTPFRILHEPPQDLTSHSGDHRFRLGEPYLSSLNPKSESTLRLAAERLFNYEVAGESPRRGTAATRSTSG